MQLNHKLKHTTESVANINHHCIHKLIELLKIYLAFPISYGFEVVSHLVLPYFHKFGNAFEARLADHFFFAVGVDLSITMENAMGQFLRILVFLLF